MRTTVKIYGLFDPDTGVLRYVGKADDVGKRFKTHLRDARRRSTPVYSWIRKLVSNGQLPKIETLAECSPEHWPEVERNVIAQYPNLLNLAEGGDQPFCPPAVRLANAHKLKDAPYRRGVIRAYAFYNSTLRSRFISEQKKEKIRRGLEKFKLAVAKHQVNGTMDVLDNALLSFYERKAQAARS